MTKTQSNPKTTTLVGGEIVNNSQQNLQRSPRNNPQIKKLAKILQPIATQLQIPLQWLLTPAILHIGESLQGEGWTTISYLQAFHKHTNWETLLCNIQTPQNSLNIKLLIINSQKWIQENPLCGLELPIENHNN